MIPQHEIDEAARMAHGMDDEVVRRMARLLRIVLVECERDCYCIELHPEKDKCLHCQIEDVLREISCETKNNDLQ